MKRPGLRKEEVTMLQASERALQARKKKIEQEVDIPALKEKFDRLTDYPGYVLEYRITNEMPAMPDFVDSNVPAVKEGLITFRAKVGEGYDNLIDAQKEHPIGFYVFVGFVVLAFLSFVLHQDKRKRRTSKPIPLPRGESVGSASRREPVAAELD
jgi:hypothetical protein